MPTPPLPAVLLALLAVAPAPAAAQTGVPPARAPEVPSDPPGVPAAPVPGAPRAPAVVLGPFASVQVNVDAAGANIPGDAANETSIAVDPTNGNRMAIGWRQFDTVSSNFRQAGVAWSADGGRTWTVNGPLEAGVFRSDPVLGFDAAGGFYYNSLQLPGGSFQCDVFRSNDGGRTWGAPVLAHGGDKAWMAIDRTAGIGAGNVYSAWSVFAGCCGNDVFTRSLDGGLSFQTPVTIANPSPVFGSMAVGPAGTVYVAGVSPSDSCTLLVARSTNAQNPLGSPTFAVTSVFADGCFTTSTGPNPAGLLSQAEIAVDPGTGDVYLCCAVDPAGPDPLDVHLWRSTDGGVTFGPTIRVNADPPAAGSWQWFATLDVAPTGRVDVVWNDTRASGQENVCELWTASSSDGGATWTPEQAVSPAWDSWVGWPNQSKIGDYYDLVSDAVGADLAWAATFNGEEDVYYLRLGERDCDRNGVPDPDDIAAGTSTDANGNGIPDACEPAVGTATCFGTGCPCGNDDPSAGCANSTGAGGRLAGFGSASVAADDLALVATGLSPDDQGLVYMGDALVSAPFFDGRQCALGNTFRFLDSIQSTGPARRMTYAAPVAGSGGLIAPGTTWHFQAWHRDFPTSPCGTGANLTSALSITFEP